MFPARAGMNPEIPPGARIKLLSPEHGGSSDLPIFPVSGSGEDARPSSHVVACLS